MVPAGEHLEQAGFGLVTALTHLMAPMNSRISRLEEVAEGAAAKANEAFDTAIKAQAAADSAIDSFKEEMAKERKAREAERKDEAGARRARLGNAVASVHRELASVRFRGSVRLEGVHDWIHGLAHYARINERGIAAYAHDAKRALVSSELVQKRYRTRDDDKRERNALDPGFDRGFVLEEHRYRNCDFSPVRSGLTHGYDGIAAS